MVLNIAALLLVLGITFMHSLFGAFSGLIDLFCCLVAMCIAFGFADLLNSFITEQGLHPAYTLPICFVALFLLTHIVLRVVADNVIRGNLRLPMYVDWGVGGLCGFFIGMITVGVLVLGFLMLPWGGPGMKGGGRVMMFSRYQQDGRDSETQQMRYKRTGLWLKPDEFTVALFNMLSNGSLKHNTSFASVYPDFPEWVFWTGNTVQPESATAPYRDDNADGFGPKGLKVLAWWEQNSPVNARYRTRVPLRRFPLRPRDLRDVNYRPDPASGMRLIGMRLALTKASADRGEGTPYHRFRPTMIRVVGDVGDQPQHYAPIILGGVEPGSSAFRFGDMDNNFAVPAVTDETKVDVYFEVDQRFRPRFVEYRRFARASVTGEPDAPPADRLVARESAAQEQYRTVGFSRFIDAVIEEGTGDRSELPFPMSSTALASANVELPGGKLRSGRIAGLRSQFAAAGPTAVKKFDVPEGYRIFQLRCRARRAGSLAGKVFDFAGSVANQYSASSEHGVAYPLSGYYAIVQRDGRDYIELYITGEPNAPGFRQMLDFKSVSNRELRDENAIIGLLFYVEPGVFIARVQNQMGQGVAFESPGYEMGGG